MTRSRRMVTAVVGVTIIGLGMPAAFAVGGALPHRAPAKPAAKAAAGELVVNGGFEDGTNGWKVNHPATQGLDTGRPVASGAAAARLTNSAGANLVVNDADPTVASTVKGRTYTLTASVRSVSGDVSGRVRVRQVAASGDVTIFKKPFDATTGAWSDVSLTFTTDVAGAELDLNIVGLDVAAGTTLVVDDISLIQTTTPPSSSSTSAAPSSPASSSSQPTSPASSASASVSVSMSTAPSSSTPTQTSSATPAKCVNNAMGIPPSGQTYLGAAVSGGNTIEGRESKLGAAMRVHRTYYSSGQIAAATRQATDDVNAGRLPWISFKAPSSWAAMATGAGDSWTTQLAKSLATVPGPVWVAVHHEPEKDGNMAEWTAMQRRIAPIIHANSNNVAFTVIYSGWNTFGGDTNTLATKWPGDAHVDVTAIDAYDDYGVKRSSGVGQKHLQIRAYYVKLAEWAKAHGTAWAVAETGQSISSAKDEPKWLVNSYHDMQSLGGAALSYFDSNDNSVTDWRLNDTVKFNAFKSILPETAKIC
ncbi:MAG: carbohydrate binding domain-containing protein [Nocardioidaceae bacterium]